MKSLASKLSLLALAASLLLLPSALAQPRLTDDKPGALSREEYQSKLQSQANLIDLGAISVNTESRENVRNFFNAIYSASEGVPIEWTGDYTKLDDFVAAAGDTSTAFKEATLLRINFYRAMVGIPADVVLQDEFNQQAQMAALIMSGNDQLSHNPKDDNFPNYITDVGHDAAGDSNLAIGSSGPDSVDGYMQDHGASNFAVGHRRWLIHPPSVEMGTGDVPGGAAPNSVLDAINTRFGYRPDSLRPANAIHVFSSNNSGSHPQTTFPYVAYPQEGYVPYQIVYPRWSFSIDGAGFGSASVTMTRDGEPIDVTLENVSNGFGDNTLVWVYDNIDSSQPSNHPRPDDDVVYEVTVSGITGAPQSSYTYSVTVIDPDVPGADYTPTQLSGPSLPGVGQSNEYTATLPDPNYFSGIRWRSFTKAAFDTTEGAESGIGELIVQQSEGYDVITSSPVASGSAAFHLAHPEQRVTQSIQLPHTFVGGPNSELSFQSRLRTATTTQIAKVQVSLDNGVSWQDVYEQAGTDDSGESSFHNRAVDLSAFQDLTFQIRFAYVHTGGSRFPQTTSNVGWFFDDITLANTSFAENIALSAHLPTDSFDFVPTAEGDYCLQAQGVLFENYPVEWGPVMEVSATANTQPTAADDPADTSEGDRAVTGNVLANDTDDNPGDVISLTQVAGDETNIGTGLASDYGFYTIMPDGSFAYAVDNSNGAVLALNAGETLTDTIAYQITDGNGLFDEGELQITINGIDGTPAEPDARIINLSTRGAMLDADADMIGGFVVRGPGAMQVMIRAIGPGLVDHQVNADLLLPDPTLELVRNFIENGEPKEERFGPVDNWEDLDDWEELADVATFQEVEAGLTNVPLKAGAKDSGMVLNLERGRYSAIVRSGDGGTGLGLVELNNATGFDSTIKFINISTRGFLGEGENVMIPGFVARGSATHRFLVRAVGPSLTTIPDRVADVKLSVLRRDTTLSPPKFVEVENGFNDDWETNGNLAELLTVTAQLGAQPALLPGAKDAALLIEVPSGVFSVVVEGVNGETGTVLVEVYNATF